MPLYSTLLLYFTEEDIDKMKPSRIILRLVVFCALLVAASAHAASVSGTVTDKTTGKPAAGDAVVLIDVQAGMAESARTTTDAKGHYVLTLPGNSSYLVRVTHQGSTYFIAAPQGGSPGDLTVYDVAAKVDGVSIVEDVFGIAEAQNGKLHVVERWLVRNSSNPPRTQWTPKSFEVVLPPEAIVQEASAQRPSGIPTTLSLDPTGTKGHYTYNFPIQPDDGTKRTLFQVDYQLPYSGKFTFHPTVTIPAHTIWVVLPNGMTLTSGGGSSFQSSPQDPSMQTFVAQDAQPGKPLEFTISGSGALPRDQQASGEGQQGAASQDAGTPGNQPGGGIGAPINTPDPLSKYKWWILGVLALLLAAGAALLLRRPAAPIPAPPGTPTPDAAVSPAAKGGDALLNVLKEELFTLESDRIGGKIQQAEYGEVKAALETVLKYALKRKL